MSGIGMKGLVERARRAAEARAEVLRSGVMARIAAALPGVSVVQDGDRIVASGRGLVRRWVARDEMRDLGDVREMEP